MTDSSDTAQNRQPKLDRLTKSDRSKSTDKVDYGDNTVRSGSPLVFSIRPEFVRMFASGSKRYELRTRRPSVSAGELVLVYETAPTSAIVAEAFVGAIHDSDTSTIWRELGPSLGVTRAQYCDYFRCRDRAVAIELRLSWLGRHVKLPAGMVPPQSWARLCGEWVAGIGVAS